MGFLQLREYEILALQSMGETTIDRALPIGGMMESYETGQRWRTDVGVVEVTDNGEYQVGDIWRHTTTLQVVTE